MIDMSYSYSDHFVFVQRDCRLFLFRFLLQFVTRLYLKYKIALCAPSGQLII